MHPRQIVGRSLTYYWRTNLAVVLGVSTAVAVLGGALLVGDSVRGSLRDLVLERLGRTDLVVLSSSIFRSSLADDLAADADFGARVETVVPLIAAPGMVVDQASGRRAGQVRVYGVDDRFWRFHGVDVTGPGRQESYVSPALAGQLGIDEGASALVRVQRPTDVPLESLHGRRDDLGRTLRVTVARVLPPEALGEFALEATQGEVLAVFVPLGRLQEELEATGQVNALLVAGRGEVTEETTAAVEALLRRHATLADVGLEVEALEEPGVISIGSPTGLLDEAHLAVARQALGELGLAEQPVFTYLANALRVADRDVPYSLVSALDLEALAAPAGVGEGGPDAIVLNAWAAEQLQARPGDALTMDYYAWEEPGRLESRSAAFTVAAIVPIEAGDRGLAPSFPGISDSPTFEDWDPPFPIDLGQVRPVDEQYWEEYRTTPKAFIPIETGQALWATRYGSRTSLRTAPGEGGLEGTRDAVVRRLREASDPLALGLTVADVRGAGLDASRGATDFGEYFVYFSFFLVVSALLLASLFFKLGVEQRVREVGLLRAVGFGPRVIRRLFLLEGLLLSVAGSVVGVAGAVGYGAVMMYGLRSWWVDAVGTTALALHVEPVSLAVGAGGGIAAALACIWWTLRALDPISERSLLAGELEAAVVPASLPDGRRAWLVAALFAALGAVLLGAGVAGYLARTGAFFGAGSALLVAALGLAAALLRRRRTRGLAGNGWWPVSRLGLRNATYRPGRSVVSIAVIASATFILISVDAFRRSGGPGEVGPDSGVGGYSLLVETLLPVLHDPNTEVGREALNLFGLDVPARFEPFRLLPGDDASCLNLYVPTSPRIIAPRDTFLDEGRFAFAGSLAETEAERANPWLLLRRQEADDAIPVIADANSMTYVLHRRLGEDIVVERGDRTIRLRLVAALSDSILQGELVMAEGPFLELFPAQEGYQVLLVETAPEELEAVEAALADGLRDLGPTVVTTGDRLAQFHRVENTYLSTFQTLGGLGLLLGTIGLAAVLLRNVLERRRELALLGAVGYRRGDLLLLVLAENLLLLGGGLLAGAASAVLAITPALIERGGRLPLGRGGAILLACVLVAGLLSSILAMRAATRAPLLASLRAE